MGFLLIAGFGQHPADFGRHYSKDSFPLSLAPTPPSGVAFLFWLDIIGHWGEPSLMTAKAIIIDPWKKTVTMEDVGTDWREIQRALSRHGHEQIPLTIGFRGRTPTGAFHAYVDDEGLFRDGQAFFECLEITGNPLAGRCIVFGDDYEGGEADFPQDMPLSAFKSLVRWIDRNEANDLVQPTIITTFDRNWNEVTKEVLGKVDLNDPGPPPSERK